MVTECAPVFPGHFILAWKRCRRQRNCFMRCYGVVRSLEVSSDVIPNFLKTNVTWNGISPIYKQPEPFPPACCWKAGLRKLKFCSAFLLLSLWGLSPTSFWKWVPQPSAPLAGAGMLQAVPVTLPTACSPLQLWIIYPQETHIAKAPAQHVPIPWENCQKKKKKKERKKEKALSEIHFGWRQAPSNQMY